MKSILIAAATVVALGVSGSAMANEALAKKAGCNKCHALDSEVVGPAYKQIAKDFKGKDEAALVAKFKSVKDHAKVKVGDDDLKAIAGWILKL